jgi:hypothetical protein
MSIDPRLMERRKTVAEDRAKENVSRLLKFLLFVVVLGSLLWLAFSPWLSVSQVTTSGIQQSDTNAVLVEEGVVAGTPMILIGAPSVEEHLLEDPWVAEATVRLDWPDEVTVEVVERVPTAWVQTEGGWARRAIDGVALPSAAEPDPEMPWIEMPRVLDADVSESSDLLGALEFVESLPDSLHPGTVVQLVDGEVWATVEGYPVRLGRAVEMTEKALSLDALMEEEIPAGSTLNLIAPTNPAYKTPGQTAEPDEVIDAETEQDAAGEASEESDGNAGDGN